MFYSKSFIAMPFTFSWQPEWDWFLCTVWGKSWVLFFLYAWPVVRDHWFISESFPTALQWHFCQNLRLCIFQDLFLGSLVYSTTKNLYNTDLMYSFIISLNTWKGKPSHHAFLQGRVLIIAGPLYFHFNFKTWLSKTYFERESHWIYTSV